MLGLPPSACSLAWRMSYDGFADLRQLDVEALASSDGFCLVPEKRELFGDLSVADKPAARQLHPDGARAAVKRTMASIAFAPRERRGRAPRRPCIGRRAPDAGARRAASIGLAC